MCEGNYSNNVLNGEDKCIWIDTGVAETYGTGYGFGIGTYQGGKRNGHQLIECFIGISVNRSLSTAPVRFDDCQGGIEFMLIGAI